MKYLRNTLAVIGGLFTALFLTALVVQYASGQPTTPSAIASYLDPIFRTMQIAPSKGSNGTNAFTVFAKSGTNYTRIEPTNANFVLRSVGSGTMHTGVTVNINVTGTNNGAFTNMQFINGLLVAP